MQAPPTIDIWYGSEQRFGHCGQPQRWANILGRVRSDQPIRQLTCTLNGSAARPLSMGPDARRLAAPGDFNIDLDCRDLAPGANTLLVAATDGAGLTTTRTVTLTVAGAPCPLPYTIDWARVEQIQDVAHVVDGRWTCGAEGVSPLEIGYDRLLAIGGGSRSRTWCQIVADATGKPVLCSDVVEASALGAAITAAVGAGWYADAHAAAAAMAARGDTEFQPQERNADAYGRLLDAYRKLYPANREILETLATFKSGD